MIAISRQLLTSAERAGISFAAQVERYGHQVSYGSCGWSG